MSLVNTKKQLIQLLSDQDNKVIALTGKWGTGKSHLWRDVVEARKKENSTPPIYVSLFGLLSMDQVKIKIFQSGFDKDGNTKSGWEPAKHAWRGASKVLQSLHPGFSALNEIALLAIPSFLKKRLIVLDDIERKHSNLSVDEVMGFIDEFTQQHESRFVLILNSDQLAEPGDQKMWETLREKVIDQEVRLETVPSEAFEIAKTIAPSPYAERIGKSVEPCGITNIRIISKIIRAVNRILGMREDLSGDILSRLIPSTVLLTATHYKGVENGPDFDFILRSSANDFGRFIEKNGVPDESEQRLAKWRSLLQELGIYTVGEYEHLIVDFLHSGLFEPTDVSKIIDRYVCDADATRAEVLARQLHEHAVWHHRLTDAELVSEAKALTKMVHLLDAFNVSSLHTTVSGLVDGQEIADAMIRSWLKTNPVDDSDDDFDFRNAFNRPLHPLIRSAFDAAKANAQAKTTLFAACKHVVEKSGWGPKQETVMKSAKVTDFEETIKDLDYGDLQLFMRQFMGMCRHPETHSPHFGPATDNFIAACRNLHNDSSLGRLPKLIKLMFKDSNLDDRLSPPVEPVEVTSPAPV